MSKVPFGALSAQGGGEETDPRAQGSFHDDRPEIQALFEAALCAELPRNRDLKPWEPQRLNERHLAMVYMRAGGLKQRQIAQAFGATDSNVSIVLNHPDAEYLLSRLQAMRATQPSEIEKRMLALAEPAVSTLEAVFNSTDPDEEKRAMRRAPLAFKVLDHNGYGRQQSVKHDHEHKHHVELDASSEEMLGLAAALRESRQLRKNEILVIDDAQEAEVLLGPVSPGGEQPSVSPAPSLLPPGTAAPSSSDSQEHGSSAEGES